MASRWSLSRQVIFDLNGELAAGALATFYEAGTTTPMAVYADSNEAAPLTSPVVANGIGRFGAVYIPYRTYKVRVTDSTGATLWDDDNILNPAPPDSGGGGGIVVSADEIWQTGDVMWQDKTGTRTGWVRDNARTLGSASSGATERANADTADLYAFLWNNFTNAECPVAGSRGASAAADFAANKTIQLPDRRGYTPIGLDDMGNSAAGRLQISYTVTTVNANTTVTLASVSGLGIGMTVTSANIPAGATITDITSSTTLIVSAAATAGASGTAARFSYVGDAQVAGSRGGFASRALLAKEVARHAHPTVVTDPGHTHTTLASTGAASVQTGGNQVPAYVLTNTGSSTTGITVAANNQTDGDTPMPLLQPSVTGTFFRKL